MDFFLSLEMSSDANGYYSHLAIIFLRSEKEILIISMNVLYKKERQLKGIFAPYDIFHPFVQQDVTRKPSQRRR